MNPAEVDAAIAAELDAAKQRLPPRVLAAIESAAHAGNLGRAREALLAFRAERPDEAAAAAAALRAHAPFVSAALADTLEPEVRAGARWRNAWPVLLVVVALLVAVRFARAPIASPPAAAPRPTIVAPAADPTRAFQRFEDSLYPDADADERARRQRVEAAAESIERAFPGRDEVASAALDAESSARRGDCASLRPRAKLLAERARTATPDASSDAAPLVTALDSALAGLCP